jgi:hypothetical protein
MHSGEGRSGATLRLSAVQIANTKPIPNIGKIIVAASMRFSIFNFPLRHVVDGELLHIFFRFGGIEFDFVERISFFMSFFGTVMLISLSTRGSSAYGGAHSLRFKFILQRDRLAVVVEMEWNDHRILRRTEQSHGRGVGHAKEHMRRLIFAKVDLVADRRPRRLFRNRRFDLVLFEQAELMRHDDRRAIRQRDDAKTNAAGFGTIGRISAAG